MFKDLKAEKIGDGKFLVSFTTEDPTMVHLARFFSIMSREADYFFRTIIRRQKDVDVNVTKADAEDTERLEAAKAERKRFKDRFDAMGGSRGERIKMLRRELHLQGCPISYDSLVCALNRANRDAKEELAGRIRKLAMIGRPVWAMAADLEIPVSELQSVARVFEVEIHEDILQVRLEETLRGLYAEGLSLEQMCNRLSLPVSLVKKAAVSAGILKARKKRGYMIGDVETPLRKGRGRGNGMGSGYTRVLTSAVAKLAAEGLSFKEIARKLRVCPVTVEHHAKLSGIESPDMIRARAAADAIATMTRKSASSAEIAKRLGISPALVRKQPAWSENLPAWRKKDVGGPVHEPEKREGVKA